MNAFMAKQWVKFTDRLPMIGQLVAASYMDESGKQKLFERLIRWDKSWLGQNGWEYPGSITHWSAIEPPGAEAENHMKLPEANDSFLKWWCWGFVTGWKAIFVRLWGALRRNGRTTEQ